MVPAGNTLGTEFSRIMNLVDEIQEPFMLEGKEYSLKEILDYCAEQARSPVNPSWRKEVLAFISLFLDPERPPITQLSSGTTGDPKSFSLDREAMLNSARRTLDFFGLKKSQTALLCLPIHYIAGKMMVIRALLGRLNLLPQEPSSRPLRDLEGIIDFTAMVPLQVEESLRQGDPLEKLSILLVGGGELHPATREMLSSRITPEVYETFGMTETYTHFALRRLNGPAPEAGFQLLKGVDIRTDSRGCLQVEVRGVTTGLVHTNDLVEINEQENGFVWKGRYDNLINSGGIKIIPEVLEEQIRDRLGHECLVLPEPDRKLGHRLALVVEFQGKEAPVDRWMNLLRDSLSVYEIPKRILTVESLPRNPFMKPDRTSARDLLL